MREHHVMSFVIVHEVLSTQYAHTYQ